MFEWSDVRESVFVVMLTNASGVLVSSVLSSGESGARAGDTNMSKHYLRIISNIVGYIDMVITSCFLFVLLFDNSYFGKKLESSYILVLAALNILLNLVSSVFLVLSTTKNTHNKIARQLIRGWVYIKSAQFTVSLAVLLRYGQMVGLTISICYFGLPILIVGLYVDEIRNDPQLNAPDEEQHCTQV